MKEREFWLDHIRGIACLLVVLLHTSSPYLYKFNKISMQSWHIGNLVDSFARVSVPLFFMISGYLMMQEKPARQKHFARIIASLLFYSALCIVYVALYRHGDWKSLLFNIYHQPVFYHLWFFYAIFSFYLLSNILTFRKNSRSAVYIIIVCMIVLNPGLNSIVDGEILNFSSKFQLNGTLIFYMLYGMAGVALGNMRTAGYKQYLLLLYIVSSVFIAFKTYTGTTEAGSFVSSYYSYTGPLVAAGALSLFCSLSSLNIKNIYYTKFISFISGISLPVYGFHVIFIDYLNRSGLRNFDNALIDIPFTFIIALAASILFALLIKKLDKYRLVS